MSFRLALCILLGSILSMHCHGGVKVNVDNAPRTRPTEQVQTYAAIDLSGTNASSDGTLIALDDDNKAVFTYTDTTSGTNCVVKKWSNGAITEPQRFSLQKTDTFTIYVSSSNRTMGGRRIFTPAKLLPDGTVYGSWSAELNDNTYKYYIVHTGGFQASSGTCSILNAPAAPYKYADTDYFDDSIYLYGVNAVGYSGALDAAQRVEGGGFISVSGTFTVFDLSGTSSVINGMNVVHKSFGPFALNKNGWAIGRGTDGNLWKEQQLSTINAGDPSALNDQNYVIGSGTDGDGYFWKNQATTHFKTKQGSEAKALIPGNVSSQYKNIAPYLISNQGTDGSFYIVFGADFPLETDPATNTSKDFVMKCASAGSFQSLATIQVPDDVALNSINTINSHGLIAATGYVASDNYKNIHALLLLPVELNAYRPQMVPNSVDLSSTNSAQMIIPQSEVTGTGVHIRVNGDNENTNLVEVSYSCPALATMTGLTAGIQVSSANLVVWSSSNKGTCITANNNQGTLTLDGSGNATVWVEALTLGTNALNSLIVSGTTTIGTSGSLNFVNYDSFTEAFSGETFESGTAGAAKAQAQGIFNVAQKLYLEGYNIAYYNVNSIDDNTGQPAYGELSNEIHYGFVKNVGVFGYSHGGGETFNICQLLSWNHNMLGNFSTTFAGYVDAIQHIGPANGTFNTASETDYPPGATSFWNYYETIDYPLYGGEVLFAPGQVDVSNTNWGANLYHYSRNQKIGIDDNQTVLQSLTLAVKTYVPKY